MQATDLLPKCPRCGGSSFRRDSMFESMQEHGQQTAEFAIPTPEAHPDWLRETRELLEEAGNYLAYCGDDEKVEVFRIKRGWTRIGRSVTANVRLDDPSVSRRHALIVSEPDTPLRVLDDRSLNGVFLNGELVEWASLEDGDELLIGRYRLFAFER